MKIFLAKYFYLEQNLFLYKVKLGILSKPSSNGDEGKDDYSTTIIDNCTYPKVFFFNLFYRQSMIFSFILLSKPNSISVSLKI